MSTSTESKSADKLLLRLVTVSEKLKTSLNHIHGDLLKEIKKLRTQLAKAKDMPTDPNDRMRSGSGRGPISPSRARRQVSLASAPRATP